MVLSPEEVARLLEAAPGLKYKAALSVAYGAGLRVSEVANLKVSDIDRERMTLRVEQGKGQRDRTVMSSPRVSNCCASGGVRRGHRSRPLSRPEPDQPGDAAPAQPRRHRRLDPCGHHQAGFRPTPRPAQLRDPSPKAGRRLPGHPGVRLVGERQAGRPRRSTPAWR